MCRGLGLNPGPAGLWQAAQPRHCWGLEGWSQPAQRRGKGFSAPGVLLGKSRAQGCHLVIAQRDLKCATTSESPLPSDL